MMCGGMPMWPCRSRPSGEDREWSSRSHRSAYRVVSSRMLQSGDLKIASPLRGCCARKARAVAANGIMCGRLFLVRSPGRFITPARNRFPTSAVQQSRSAAGR